MSASVVLGDRDLARLQRLLASAAGLVFDDGRRGSLAYCLAERLRATGIGDAAAYLDVVCEPGAPERQHLLEAVTIQETHFFRNPPQMEALRSQVLPELIRAAAVRDRRLRIWSAGCATGEEAYSVALLLRELLPVMDGWDVSVLATDLSQSALALARRAVYGSRSLQLVSADRRRRFFEPTTDGGHRVRDEVAGLVSFRHHNLVVDPPPAGGADLVLCRNVTIYFGRETTRALVGRLHAALRDGGYLLLGHAETLWQVSDDFRLVATGAGPGAAYVYRREAATVPGGAERRARVRVAAPRRPPATVAPAGSANEADPADAARTARADGRYEEAAGLARRAAAADPLRADLHFLLGSVLMDLGQDREALLALRRAAYLAPEAGLPHFLLAGVLARTGDAVAAAREYRAAAATLGRTPIEAHELGGRSPHELAALCARLGSGDAPPAVDRSAVGRGARR